MNFVDFSFVIFCTQNVLMPPNCILLTSPYKFIISNMPPLILISAWKVEFAKKAASRIAPKTFLKNLLINATIINNVKEDVRMRFGITASLFYQTEQIYQKNFTKDISKTV